MRARLGRILAPAVDAFRLPDPRSQWVGRLHRGQQVAIVSQWQGWFALLMADASQAYVPQALVEVLPYQVTAVEASPDSRPARPAPAGSEGTPPAGPMAAASLLARGVIQEAFRLQGVPYQYGGDSEKGLDCSALVRRCFASQGINLPRRASEQAGVGEDVPLDRLQPGDRLYFSVKNPDDHTGIYLGEGYFIHASALAGKVAVEHLSTPLYRKNLTGARRL